MSKISPIVLSVAPNGSSKTKKDHPNLPISSDEIVKEAIRCCDAGASLLHLHIRDKAGCHILDAAKYKSTIKAIKKAVDNKLIIQITTESCGLYNYHQQIELVRAVKPESASFSVREFFYDKETIATSHLFFNWCLENHIYPQYILYSLDDLKLFAKLKEDGVIPGKKQSLLFVVGKYDKSNPANTIELLHYLNLFYKYSLEDSVVWSACAFGRSELACMVSAATFGGHVRVGFENNMHLVNGEIAQNNSDLIKAFCSYGNLFNRDIANAERARKLLLLS